MRTYPEGVLQNRHTPGPALWGPVDPQNWSWFSTALEAKIACDFARLAISDVQLIDARDQFPQFEFTQPGNDIRIWTITAPSKPEMKEFAGAIYDSAVIPRPFVDQYAANEPRKLVWNDGVLRWVKAS